MKCIFILISSLVYGCLDSVDLAYELYPAFLSEDSEPYLVTEIVTDSAITIYFKISSPLSVSMNSLLRAELELSSPLEFELVPGTNELSLACLDKSYTFQIYCSKANFTDYEVSANESYTVVESVFPLQLKAFSMNDRHGESKILSGEMAVSLFRGKNFIILTMDEWAEILLVEVPELSTDLKSLQIDISDQHTIVPRLTNAIYDYKLDPPLDSDPTKYYSLQIYTHGPCFLTISSYNGLFPNQYVLSGDLVEGLLVTFNGDTLILTVEDSTSEDVIDYYIEVPVKSNSKYLQSLQFYKLTPSEEIPIIESYIEASACCELPGASFTENFHVARTVYKIKDLEYDPDLSYLAISIPEESTSQIDIQINFQGYRDYLASDKVIKPLIGDNEVNFKVTAEDPSFQSIVSVLFYMKSNDAHLTDINIQGDWSPAFQTNQFLYRVFVNYDTSEIEVNLAKSHSESSVSSYLDTKLQSHSTTFKSEMDSLSAHLSIKVRAESNGWEFSYEIYISKKDICGNGLRFSTTELCDDGNLVAGDGCSSTCQIESGFSCTGGSETSKDECQESDRFEEVLSECGNGSLETLEECDDGNLEDLDGCSKICKKELLENSCGDGIRLIGSSEECDDGNLEALDGCYDCYIEEGFECSNSALITNLVPRPDQCSVIEDIEEDEEFNYIHNLSFIVGITLVVALGTANVLIVIHRKDSKGLNIGCILYVVILQVSFTQDMESEFVRDNLSSLAWSHLRFYGLALEGKDSDNGLGIQYMDSDLFIENTQYIILIAVCLIAVHLGCFIWKKKFPMWIDCVFYVYTYIPVLYSGFSSLFAFKFGSAFAIASYVFGCVCLVLYIGGAVFMVIKYKEFSNVLSVGLKVEEEAPDETAMQTTENARRFNDMSFRCGRGVSEISLEVPQDSENSRVTYCKYWYFYLGVLAMYSLAIHSEYSYSTFAQALVSSILAISASVFVIVTKCFRNQIYNLSFPLINILFSFLAISPLFEEFWVASVSTAAIGISIIVFSVTEFVFLCFILISKPPAPEAQAENVPSPVVPDERSERSFSFDNE